MPHDDRAPDLESAPSRSRWVSRFAPAPTGRLHLGHVVNAIYVWGITRVLGGEVRLRIEDHDRQRCRPEFERGILDDLEWLGFEPDGPPLSAFRSGVCRGRQSDRADVYERALSALRRQDLVYACECSRRDIERAKPRAVPSTAPAATAPAELRYPGTCADRQLPETDGRGLRLRVPVTRESFSDARHGAQVQCPSAQCGDLLLRDRDGSYTYQFAVTVDDWQQGVTLVIRGDDLLPSTGRQMLLARLLGRATPPRFVHHPLVMKSSTQKLSKGENDTSVASMREAGVRADVVIARAARAVQLIDTAGPLSARDVPDVAAHRLADVLAALHN